MEKKPLILDTKTLARTRLFHIQEVALRFANGNTVRYERLISSGKGAVLVVPLWDEDTVLLIREYGAGVDRYEIGLPKGRIEEGEGIFEAANREIMEEVGYGAHDFEHLTSLSIAPGYLSHITHVVLAHDLYPKRLPGDEPEAIEVVPWSLSRLSELVACGECTEARTLAALFITRERLKEKT